MREGKGREGFKMAQIDKRAGLLVPLGEEEEKKIFGKFFFETYRRRVLHYPTTTICKSSSKTKTI